MVLTLIVDGGYHKWRCLLCPFKGISTQAQLKWSNRLESVRKDVGCYFERQKGWFRILKLPMLYWTSRIARGRKSTTCPLNAAYCRTCFMPTMDMA
ncbi:unnamed protein product, partial [Discosporangium mesarthrocarpum]